MANQDVETGKVPVNSNDPIEMQRIQETKPARTSTGPGETSVPKSEAPDQASQADKESSETNTPPRDASDEGDQQTNRV